MDVQDKENYNYKIFQLHSILIKETLDDCKINMVSKTLAEKFILSTLLKISSLDFNIVMKFHYFIGIKILLIKILGKKIFIYEDARIHNHYV